MLQLVAEQARELVGADCCVTTVAAPRPAADAPRRPRTPRTSRRWSTFVRWLDLHAIYELVRAQRRLGQGRPASSSRACRRSATVRASAPLRGWLAASLTALDGTELGAIQLFDKQHGAFTADDEAALVHLAQMASAAVERARLYQERGRRRAD